MTSRMIWNLSSTTYNTPQNSRPIPTPAIVAARKSMTTLMGFLVMTPNACPALAAAGAMTVTTTVA